MPEKQKIRHRFVDGSFFCIYTYFDYLLAIFNFKFTYIWFSKTMHIII